jgi:mannose-6-phosphate isomerase-like protein (cupin superfamily)
MRDKHMSRKVAWISDIRTSEKPWGNEKVWSNIGHIHGKILSIKKGHRTSLKRYQMKNESFYLLSGKVAVTYGDEKTTDPKFMMHGELAPDQILSVPSMCPYRLEALEDSVLIETSDYRDQDYEVLDDDYER